MRILQTPPPTPPLHCHMPIRDMNFLYGSSPAW